MILHSSPSSGSMLSNFHPILEVVIILFVETENFEICIDENNGGRCNTKSVLAGHLYDFYLQFIIMVGVRLLITG